MGDRRIRFTRGQGLWLFRLYKRRPTKTSVPIRYEDASFAVLMEKAGRQADLHCLLRSRILIDEEKMMITLDVSPYYKLMGKGAGSAGEELL